LLAIASGGCDDPEPRTGEDPYDPYGYGSGSACEPEVQTFDLSLPANDPPLELRIESCRRDVDACLQLCAFLIEDPFFITHDVCRVRFLPDLVQVSLTFSQGWCP
jgi:hypothetical protein